MDAAKLPKAEKVNKRQNKRMKAALTISYQVTGQEKTYSVISTDVSSKSIAFKDQNQIPIGTSLSAEILLPTLSKPLKIKGSIKRIEEVQAGQEYIYALVFEEVDKATQSALESYIQATDINQILRAAASKNASDLHLVVGHPPVYRVEGELIPADSYPLSAEELKSMIYSVLSDKQIEAFNTDLELDFAYTIPEGSRFRGNIHLDKGNIEAAFRVIPSEVRSAQDLGLPPVMEMLAKKKKGLILLCGPSGSGKSTTLTTLIDMINKNRKCLIVSIEDPIEYLHKSKKSIIKQREVGIDTLSFAAALKHVLRQDPNVILVGEMRDLESIAVVVTAAETGHLVLSTLSATDAVEAINRIIDVYPKDQQEQVRNQIAGCLQAVIVQALVPAKNGRRVLATEVLVVTSAIKSLIANGQLSQIVGYMEAGANEGMHLLDGSLFRLVASDIVDKEVALTIAKDPKKFVNLI